MTDNSSITKKLREPHQADGYAGYFQVKDPGDGPFYIWDPKDLKLRRNDHGDYFTIRWDDKSLEDDRKNRKIQRDHVFEIQYVLKLFVIQLWEDKSSMGSFWFPPDTLEWISSIVNYPANVVILPTDFHAVKTSYFRKGSSDPMTKEIFQYLVDCQKLFSARFEYIRGQLRNSGASNLTKIIVNEFLDKMEQTPWCKPDVWEEISKSGKPWSLPGLVAEQSQAKPEESFILPPYPEAAANLTAYCTHKGGCECLATMDKSRSRHRTVAVTLYLLVTVLSLNVATIFAIHVIRNKQRLSTSL